MASCRPQQRAVSTDGHSMPAATKIKTFNELLAKHRIRPTAMYPVWQAAATVLGWTTGMMGKEAAMACTEAVETEIGNHYNSQIRELFKWMTELKESWFVYGFQYHSHDFLNYLVPRRGDC